MDCFVASAQNCFAICRELPCANASRLSQAMTGILYLHRICGPDPPADVGPLVPFNHGDIVLALQIEPELRIVAEIAAQPHGRICRYRAPSIENVGDAPRRDAQVQRQTIRTELASFEFALQKPAWMDRGSRVLPLVVVDNLDVESIARAEFEADTPAVIHRHGPLLLPGAIQFVQADAPQRTEVLKALGDVERQ
jgi:hypothetical protein